MTRNKNINPKGFTFKKSEQCGAEKDNLRCTRRPHRPQEQHYDWKNRKAWK
jgi:hypothetical protein